MLPNIFHNGRQLSRIFQCTLQMYRQRSLTTGVNEIPLSKDHYNIKRGPFSVATDADIKHFESILPAGNQILLGLEETVGYNRDYFKYVRGLGAIVLKPRTSEEVSNIMRYCNNKRLAVSVFGGNTGVCGGSIPVFDEIILSMDLMNRVESIDKYSGILVCESGCVLGKLEEELAMEGMMMPLDLGAKNSCQIGGNVSTNAGGIRLLRYGSLHGSVLGLEVVLADGTIMDLMSNVKKDNTGYHLKHMFIGSEGTLGVITRVAIACPTATKTQNVLFLGLRDYSSVLRTFLECKACLGEILTSFELIDRDALECCIEHLRTSSPIGSYPFYVLIETTGSSKQHDAEKIRDYLEHVIGHGIVSDGVVTNEPSKITKLWQLRERIPEATYSNNFCLTFDLSLPLKNFYDIVPAMKDRVGHLVKLVCGFGHIGDSNIHLNIAGDELTPEIAELIDPFVYEFTRKLRGSISAEHGIGLLKPKYLKYSKSAESIDLMKQLKLVLDRNGILNPYKVLC
ncbi:D-2-hydroxyglutarate dehydrogenase, mitochondrial isoform X2 [Toxorhynchites rutilus septentrionalis]|uniref:D-2-hydroxyglutarate dehydrogenase, mitochondrial isoform X2 n=1 Tax=Toxorhynchites rutilus septentrionalis TaxID=329112 RepID=UPI002479CC40|nr:D-2-hydroxyglutarate dehydrogenase, mitochondrial isoform X2 [Toxorhynchites rutilus septentrionalis]XP_055644126.1 D-2-hydroxyglutarate dehydrogenase, mitochondrial isoform X2 [Toxorhynchites rutilus septentrionalis]